MVPDESDMLSTNKEKVLANIDVAMGGHVAEKLYLGSEQITTGCGSDLKGATSMAYEAVRKYGMFGEDAGYMSIDKQNASEAHNAMVDMKVRQILEVKFKLLHLFQESEKRVRELLTKKDNELRILSKNLFWYDYLDHDEIERVISGKELDKERIREWDKDVTYAIKF